MLSFEELTEARHSLQSFCFLHEPSLLRLQSGVSFKLLPTEEELGNDEVRHLTTTATCLSSLIDCPPRFQTAEFKRVKDLQSKFADKALVRPFKDWISEGSAGVYCRCRTLPTVIEFSTNFDKRIKKHIAAILSQLDETPERFGIGEAGTALKKKYWYPPNAFHTYWTLDILDSLERKYKNEYDKLSESLDLNRRRNSMLLWGRQTLGNQLGLHSASPQSSMLDSDQLAWSLAIFLRFDQNLNVNLENRDFIKQALKCLFSTQTDGTWRHYKPLFHYKNVGNAYCYVFETFTALLQCALQVGYKAEMVRELLKPYCKNLIDLWLYSETTKIDLREYYKLKALPLPPSGKEYGWCSGHRTNVPDPESWATASVFSYAQALRRLVGIWCREEALSGLNTPPDRLSPDEAAKTIVSRGKTWGGQRASVVEQLWTMFINPVRMSRRDDKLEDDKLEPDSQPIEQKHARSAILFGPPGTSKTTLVRSLADVIEWKYVELHANHFVAEGLAAVQKTADKIFKQLSELDHAVVLFDEIDELVRERDIEKDAFGRFLTTSMLPKLAELWEKRKVLYFVATNQINYFDSAIIRSHRFDALILVSPPSFNAKCEKLKDLLPDAYHSSIPDSDVEEKVEKELANLIDSAPGHGDGLNDQELKAQREAYDAWLEQKIQDEYALAKFLLLRYDELDELAYRTERILESKSTLPPSIPADTLREALMQIADSQWRKNKSYVDYARDKRSERRDYQMVKAWEVIAESVNGHSSEVIIQNGREWLARKVDSLTDIHVASCKLVLEPPGSVMILSSPAAAEPLPHTPPPSS